jgi:diguanylate cyclase (GGDEF)-like protein
MMRLDALLSKRRTGRQTGLLFCDLDNLKQINDTAGHAAGDAVISAVAQRIRSAVRSDDICARFGGDEFVVVLLGLHGLHQAVAIAEKIRQAATAPVRISDGSSVTPSLSIGVTLAHEEEGSSALLDRADAAMYDAKESGRNAVAAIE